MTTIQTKAVIKRDGTIAVFDGKKITVAIEKAFAVTKEEYKIEALSEAIAKRLTKERMSVEEIQDIVEEEMEKMYPKTAKKYILYREEHRKKREEVKINTTMTEWKKTYEASIAYFKDNLYGYIVYLRTYAKYLEDKNRRESWLETVDRYMNYMTLRLSRENLTLPKQDYDDIRQAILNMEIMPSMRLLQFAGPCVDRNDLYSYNCSFIAPETLKDLRDIMYVLMCGTGCGFSVEKGNVEAFPEIKTQIKTVLHGIADDIKEDTLSRVMLWKKTFALSLQGKCSNCQEDVSLVNFGVSDNKIVCRLCEPYYDIPTWIVEDSKEGWCDAYYNGLRMWVNGRDVKFDYSRVRPLGSRLKGTGGHASGPQPLKDLLDFARTKILARQGKKLRSIDVHDIVCQTGKVVVAGNIRRSALLSLSDLDDHDMRYCKSGEFWKTDDQRFMANNSAVYMTKPTESEFMAEWKALVESRSGERGIHNRSSLDKQLPERRTKYLADNIKKLGVNPCLPGDTMILTSHGLKTITSLLGKPFVAIVNGEKEVSTEDGFFSKGTKKIYKVTLDNGVTFKGTKNHQFAVEDGKKMIWRAIENMDIGDTVVLSNNTNYKWTSGVGTYEEGYNFDLNKWPENISYVFGQGLIAKLRECPFNAKYVPKVQSLLLAMGMHTILEQDRNGYYRVSRHTYDNFQAKVQKIEEAGEEEVYDCTIYDVSCFSANGVITANCGEILLQPHGLCNLSTIICRPSDDEKSLQRKIRLAAILGTYQSMLTNIKYVSPNFKKHADEERLLGVSMTGQFDCPTVRDKDVLIRLRETVIKTNVEYAKLFKINPSTAVTAVKPEGTVSSMVGAAPGLHPRYAPYYIRRIRIGATDPLCQLLKDQGVPWEKAVENPDNLVVFSFYIKSPEKSIFRKDLKALDMLEYWRLAKVNYTEHNPSVTVDVGDDEWDDCAKWLLKNWEIVGGLSFLPRSDIVYQQLPYEEITKETYEKIKPMNIDFSKLVYYETEDMTDLKKELACAGKEGCDV